MASWGGEGAQDSLVSFVLSPICLQILSYRPCDKELEEPTKEAIIIRIKATNVSE